MEWWRSNSCFAAFNKAAVQRTSWRAYLISVIVTRPVGLWSIFWGKLCFLKAFSSQAFLRDSGWLNSAHNSVRRSRNLESLIFVGFTFPFFGIHSNLKRINDFLLSIGSISTRGCNRFSLPSGCSDRTSDHSFSSPSPHLRASLAKSKQRLKPTINAPLRAIL